MIRCQECGATVPPTRLIISLPERPTRLVITLRDPALIDWRILAATRRFLAALDRESEDS